MPNSFYKLIFVFILIAGCKKTDLNDIFIQDDKSGQSPSNSAYQNLVWSDEFNGQEPNDNPDCFSRSPICVTNTLNADAGTCPGNTDIAQLSKLNKCKWRLYADYNFYDPSNRSAWHPNQIEIKNESDMSFLRLKTKYRKDRTGQTNCTRATDTVISNKDCLFEIGGMDSNSKGDKTLGRNIKVGSRVEARVRMSNHPNMFPAVWMWPSPHQDGNPYYNSTWDINEIDLMENKRKNANDATVFQTVHDWNSPDQKLYPSVDVASTKNTYTLKNNEWHIFGAERIPAQNGKPKSVRLYIDNTYTLTVYDGERAMVGDLNIEPILNLYDMPMHLILNTGLHFYNNDYESTDGASFDVDWVRIYE